MAKKSIPPLPTLSDSQLEIMNVVWDKGEVTVTDVWSTLVRNRVVARNTVLTLIDRLEKKGWLKRRVEKQAHYYSATVARAATLGQVVHRLVNGAFAGSAEALVLALLEGRGVTDAEVVRIQKLINEARNRTKKP
jgi:BlaI family transcriptional regulator, penicillinase repressor